MSQRPIPDHPDGQPGVAAARWRELRSALAGETLAENEQGYEEARALWNGMIDRRPRLIARCADPDDVVRCVRFAGEQGVELTVRGGGHNIGGRALVEGGLVADLSGWRRVVVDADAGEAVVGAGATLGDVDRATQEHGLAVPVGIVSQTGIGGLTLGGGFGWLSRRFGLACDHLVAAEVVTAAGERLTVDEGNHPDLFWALRGGGGGFAAVTSLRFRLRPVGPVVAAGLVVHRGGEAMAAAAHYRETTAAAPETLGSFFLLRLAPPAPFLPAAMHGQPIAAFVVCHHGDEDAAARDLAPWRSWGAPVADVVAPRRFADFQSLFDPQAPKGRRYYWRSEYVGGFEESLAAVLADHAARITSPFSDIKVFHLGGAVSRVPAGTTAAAHRDAEFIVVVAAAWTDAAEDERHIGWVRDCWRDVDALSGRGGYLNFLTADAAAPQVRGAYGGVDLDRLRAVKRRYDPTGLLGGGSLPVD